MESHGQRLLWGITATLLASGCTGGARDVIMAPPPRPPVPEPARVAAAEVRLPPPPRVLPSTAAPRTVTLGRSTGGVPIVMQVFGSGAEHVFIFGGIHGSEAASAGVARQLARYLQAHPELWEDRTIGVVAEANPDGLAAGARGNGAGVDLNRNFPARNWQAARRGRTHGSAPASEAETQAVLRAIELLRPQRVLSLHVIGRGRACNNYDGPASELAGDMARHNGYPVRPHIGYATPGSFGSWAGQDRGIPTVTLELPAGANTAACWEANRDALLAFIRGE